MRTVRAGKRRLRPFWQRCICTLAVVPIAGLASLAASPSIGASLEPRATAAFTSTAAGAACGGKHAAAGPYRHVIWIWMENHGYDAVIGAHDAPFANQLAAGCGLATNYHNVTHPSLPNYIAATSGDTQGITDDCEPDACPRGVQSVFGQAAAAGKTWAAYDESMPSACDLSGGSGPNPDGEYAPKHNPAVYYLPLRAVCHQRVVALGTPSAGRLAHDLRSGGLPAFSFISPNLCNDTHDCPVATGDAWLSRWVRAIVSSKVYRAGRTVVFITWDEGEGGGSRDCAANTTDPGCHVAMLVVSPSTPRGTRSARLFNHYALLKTTEQLLGIKSYLGHAGDPGTSSMRTAFHL
jgi:phosphatidylinositol-3-phosphatase